MSSRMTIDNGGNIVVTEEGRTVFDPEHLMVGLLPPGFDFSLTVSVTFPDFTKDYDYHWFWESQIVTSTTPDQMRRDNACEADITAIPQRWSALTELATVPDTANIAFMLGRINRTSAPSHSWGGSAIEVRTKTNGWLPWAGTVQIEAELGMSRLFGFHLDDGKLWLHREQSVGAAAGGYGQYGNTTYYPSGGGTLNGGQHLYGSQPGIPVYRRDSRVGTRITNTNPNPITHGTPNQSCYIGGSEACAYNDITNYSSTYQVELIGKFGRRPTP